MSSDLKLRKKERGGYGWGSRSEVQMLPHIDFHLFQIVLPIGGNSRWWRGESGDCATSATSPTYTAPSKLSRPLINWVLLLVLYPWNAATRALPVLRCYFCYIPTSTTLVPPNCPSCSTATDHFGKPLDVNYNVKTATSIMQISLTTNQ